MPKSLYLRLVLTVIAALIAYLLRELLLILLVSFIVITALLPVVRALKAKHVPKTISATSLLLLVVVVPLFALFRAMPQIVEQSRSLVDQLPEIIESVESNTGINIHEDFNDSLQGWLSNSSDVIFAVSTSAVDGVIAVIITLVLIVYGLTYYDQVSNSIITFFAKKEKDIERYEHLLFNIEQSVGRWLKGQLIVSLLIGILVYIAYLVIGLPFAGLLAIIAGILELLPGLGPTIAAIPALVVALAISPQTFLLTLAAYLLIQFIESYIVTPRIMGGITKINPFGVLIVVLTGTYLLGIIGAFIALPIALILIEIYRFMRSENSTT